jgi:hypothetical protein
MWGAPLRNKLPPMHEDHVIRRAYVRICSRIKQGGYASADDYHADKDDARRLLAKLHSTSECKIDPMGFWFGRQSN